MGKKPRFEFENLYDYFYTNICLNNNITKILYHE